MPNWSYNKLSISGELSEMKSFYESSIKPDVNGDLAFKFSNIFPMPEKIKNTISPSSSAKGRKWVNEHLAAIRDKKISDVFGEESDSVLIPCENNTDEKCQALQKEFGADNWYDWNIMTYGTKWDVEVQSDSYHISEETFNANFDTAWSPPALFLEKLQSKFPKLDIALTYDLEGSDSCGIFETYRNDDNVTIEHSEADVEYKGEEGEDIYFSDKDCEWHYSSTDEVCYDYCRINPFDEN
jgi:hypothetical protein